MRSYWHSDKNSVWLGVVAIFLNLLAGLAAPANAATEKVLYSFFGHCSDGWLPEARQTYVNGTLYGTTESGGTCIPGTYTDYGTVFSIAPSGTETVLHSFSGGSEGSSPYANLINVKGTLYGTTETGGRYGGGTVFSITP